MQQDYKNKIYNNYHTIHTRQLYGTVTLDSIKKQFTALKYYYSEFLPKDKSACILDAGCGTGGYVAWLTSLGYTNVIGIDVSKENEDIGHSLNIMNIFQEDIFEHLQKNKNKYDIIFCRDVLEHLTKSEVFEIFNLFFNSLKPEGKIIVQVPNGYSPNYGKIFYSDFTHETLFSEAVINQLYHAAGFKSMSIKEIAPVPKGIKSVVRFVLWVLLRQWYKFIQLIETGSSKGFYSQNIIACITK